MINAEEIVELERKWLIYKIKQRSKIYAVLIFLISSIAFAIYYLFFMPSTTIKEHKAPRKVEKIDKKIIIDINTTEKIPKIVPEEKKSQSFKIEEKPMKQSKKTITTKKNSKPYHFKIEPRHQDNELFSSNGFLTLNLPFKDNIHENIIPNEEVIPPAHKIKRDVIKKPAIKKKTKITIDMQEVDTIDHLKNKFYATSSITFALMLAEEYYNVKDYTNSLQWALTANDIDAENTKSWYWFARSKVKLNQKKDAVRALKAFLTNNNSRILSTLLNKIEFGDTDD